MTAHEAGQKRPISLYIHLPWCVKKCPYCDFNSHQGIPQQREYLDALIRELILRSKQANNRQIHSIYCGGGTPNLLPPEFYHRLFTEVRKLYELTGKCEITLEANPGEKRIHDFAGYSQAGFNRLSIGAQSFHEPSLHLIGRDYNNEQLMHCLHKAKESPINNINIDLIFALPQQSKQQALKDLQQAIALKPQHLSIYELTLETNTIFYSKPPKHLPDDDSKADMYYSLQSEVENNGYQQYEVSAYALPEKESWHNTNYWNFGDYIGIGAGAHGKISQYEPFIIERYNNHRQPTRYMQSQEFTSQQRPLNDNDIFQEWCLNAFRLKKGSNITTSCENTGFSKSKLLQHLAVISQYLEPLPDKIKLSKEAYLRQNLLLEKLSERSKLVNKDENE